MRPLILSMLLLGLALPAAAQETGEKQPAGPPSKDTVWVVTFQGKEIGTETAREAVEGKKRILSSKGDIQLPGAPQFDFDHKTEVSAADGTLISYRLSSSMITASAAPIEGGATVKVAYLGNEGSKTVKAKGPLVVLDNLVWSQFSLLARLAAKHDAEFDLTVLVPQRQAGVPGKFKPGEPFKAKQDDAEVEVRRGELSLAGQLIRLTYDKSGRAYRVELPAAKFDCSIKGFVPPQVKEDEVQVRWRESEIVLEAPLGKLPGTLTLPLATAGVSPYPGVVLVQGSGPNDRDETIGPNKPFRDLAHGLAKRGIASVRYDKRTFVMKEQFFAGGDVAKKAAKALETLTLRGETIDDAIFAIEWLKARKDISRCYVIGHSLGAMAAPEIAAGTAELSGVIMMAGPARGLDVLTVEQMVYKAKLAGKTQEEAEALVEESVGKLFKQARAGEMPDSARIMGATVLYWRDMFTRDDVPAALAKVEQPVLLLHGSADYQVRVVDYEALKRALESREGVAHEARLFEGLNHLFMPVKGQSTGAEYMIKGKLSEEVIDTIEAWIKA